MKIMKSDIINMPKLNILGISCYYHDASACLIQDGKLTVAAQEERFTRKKHDTSFPINAINFCLTSQNITIDNIHHVAFYEKPLLKFDRFLSQSIEGFPKTVKLFLREVPFYFTKKLRISKKFKKALKYKGEVFFLKHHLSHAATSFLLSPFKEAAIVTIDGVGEWETTTYGIGKNTKINLIKKIDFPHSLGLLYSTITAYLGFKVNNSEYKVMGLSAYGKMNRNKNDYYTKIRKVIDLKKDGSFSMNLDYFSYCYQKRMPSVKLCNLLGGNVRKAGSELEERHKDIAAALQMVYEDALFNILNCVQRETGIENLVLGGGCGLNSVANGKILKKTNFKNLWISPDPGDGGSSIGAAAYAYSVILRRNRTQPFCSPYLGPAYSNKEIKLFLEDKDICYHTFHNREEKIKTAARMIYEDKIIAWFQGSMEWGPRALGTRSILANPTNPDMKDILNKKVKHREVFRPFAPVVCREDVKTFFEIDELLPIPAEYMLMVYPIKNSYHDRIPAVTHIDGTGRLQVIKRESNPDYYDLIKEFGKLSGISILINTSFNVKEEPIVCTPHDAYKCMMGTGIDTLFMGDFLIYREENKKDIWYGEKHVRGEN